MSTLARLQTYNREFASRCNVARWFGALFHVGVEECLIEDAKAEQAMIAATAYSAEQADLEALKLLEAVSADNEISADEMRLVKTACRHIRHSAEKDRAICEVSHV